jgi:hypothetical protein
MSRLFKIINILFSLFFIGNIQAEEIADPNSDLKLDVFIEKISEQSSQQLYDIDTSELESQLIPLLRANLSVQSVEIIESIDNETVLRFYRSGQALFFNREIPPEINNYAVRTSSIFHEDELVGSLIIHYVKNELFTVEDVSSVLKRLENNKACGSGNIVNACLKSIVQKTLLI